MSSTFMVVGSGQIWILRSFWRSKRPKTQNRFLFGHFLEQRMEKLFEFLWNSVIPLQPSVNPRRRSSNIVCSCFLGPPQPPPRQQPPPPPPLCLTAQLPTPTKDGGGAGTRRGGAHLGTRRRCRELQSLLGFWWRSVKRNTSFSMIHFLKKICNIKAKKSPQTQPNAKKEHLSHNSAH